MDTLPLRELGPAFENAPEFPERVNTEFVRVVNPVTLKMRVFERGNGETFACGSGACAAVVAAVENGYCEKDRDITVKVRGGPDCPLYYGRSRNLDGRCETDFHRRGAVLTDTEKRPSLGALFLQPRRLREYSRRRRLVFSSDLR
ncbi:MAG: hypothetical protein L6V84_00065 [Oscillospiraceae bacterium]|nr:MAG: hypothetical protein L6V84_00065 [Oscillospiraceae bacterium]